MGSSASSLKSRRSWPPDVVEYHEVGSTPISSYEGTAIKVIQQNFTRVKQDVLMSLPASQLERAATLRARS